MDKIMVFVPLQTHCVVIEENRGQKGQFAWRQGKECFETQGFGKHESCFVMLAK